MKGATAEPPVNTTKAPRINKTIMIGANQNFFLVQMKSAMSLKELIFCKVNLNQKLASIYSYHPNPSDRFSCKDDY